MPVVDIERLIDNRVTAIQKYHADACIQRAELDLSGGIDSAVMAGLLVLALGAENVTLAHTKINTNPVQSRRAQDLAAAIGCRLILGQFNDAYNVIIKELFQSLHAAGYDKDEIKQQTEIDQTVLGSIRSTLRAPLGRAYNRLTGGGIRHGTGNECEDRFLRFYQKGGDGEVDTNPLGMLSKTEVYQLAFGLARRFDDAVAAYTAIIDALPSPDLWGTGDNHGDETELHLWTGAPFTYGRIDSTTGIITSIGTIERVSRFLDEFYVLPAGMGNAFGSYLLFNKDIVSWNVIIDYANSSGCFVGVSVDEITTLLQAAQRIEAITRHKENPAIPMLGNRLALVEANILTNDLDWR